MITNECVGSSGFSGFLLLSIKWIVYEMFPVGVNERVNAYTHGLLGEFPPHTQCSQDRLWIQSNPVQDKVLTP